MDVHLPLSMGTPKALASLIKLSSGNTSLIAAEREIYSASKANFAFRVSSDVTLC